MSLGDIEVRAREIAALPAFAIPNWWLTFYFSGTPEQLDSMGDEMTAMEAVNLDGSDGGFLYPKVPVANNPVSVAALVNRVRQLAAVREVDVMSVDVDTDSDVESSTFKELARFNRQS